MEVERGKKESHICEKCNCTFIVPVSYGGAKRFCSRECGVKSSPTTKIMIEVHHIKSLFEIMISNKIKTIDQARICEELWDINNGEVLCRSCHVLTDNYSVKFLLKSIK